MIGITLVMALLAQCHIILETIDFGPTLFELSLQLVAKSDPPTEVIPRLGENKSSFKKYCMHPCSVSLCIIQEMEIRRKGKTHRQGGHFFSSFRHLAT